MPTVLCYGDSNTFGTDPITLGRLPRDVRWPGVLAAELEGIAHVVEEGLGGRTTVWDDPYTVGRNGMAYLLPCLRSHQPLDVVVIMLGTNDLKSTYRRTAAEIAAGAAALVELTHTSGTGPAGGRPAVLLVSPPRLGPATDLAEGWLFGEARAVSERLPAAYRHAAELKGAAFLDAAALVGGDPADGVHLSAVDHGILGRAVARAIRGMLEVDAG